MTLRFFGCQDSESTHCSRGECLSDGPATRVGPNAGTPPLRSANQPCCAPSGTSLDDPWGIRCGPRSKSRPSRPLRARPGVDRLQAGVWRMRELGGSANNSNLPQ